MGLRSSGTLAAHVGSKSIFLKVFFTLAIKPTINLEDVRIKYAKQVGQ
jgi:hypothetical protein